MPTALLQWDRGLCYIFRMTWDDHAATWDDDPAVRAYSAAAFEALQRQCVDLGVALEGARALDFGCGTGLLTERLAPRCDNVVAVDASAAMIEVLERKQAGGALGNVVARALLVSERTLAEDAAFADPFDLVVCSSVCAFLDDYPAMLALLAARLRPGGIFVQWDWELDPSAEEPFGLSNDQVREAIQAAGLEVVTIGRGFSVAFEDRKMEPLMGVGRRR